MKSVKLYNTLHKFLKKQAKAEGVPMFVYVNMLLTENIFGDKK